MRLHGCLAISLLLLSAAAALPTHGEQVKYYVWTDENGQRHFEDRPPKGRDYETRIIELGDNVVPAPDTGRGEYGDSSSRAEDRGQQSSGSRSVEPTEDIKDAAIAEEEEENQQGNGSNSGGADTATGADTANPGSTAAGSGAAASGAPASGAATAPGATLVPPPPAPVFGP